METNQEQPQAYYQPQGYAAPQPPMAPVISVKEWMLTMLIMIIPIVNIIMAFVWAFGEGNPTKQNYFKATLIWMAIGIVLSILYIILIVVVFASMFSNLNY